MTFSTTQSAMIFIITLSRIAYRTITLSRITFITPYAGCSYVCAFMQSVLKLRVMLSVLILSVFKLSHAECYYSECP
jgi:hypothetical protein